MTTAEVITAVIAVAALLLSLLNTLWRWQDRKRDLPQVTVTMDIAIPTTGPYAFDQMLQLTAANKGKHPVSVSGMSLDISGGNTMPFMELVPDGGHLGVLQPGDHASMWLGYEAVKATLLEHHARLVGAHAHGPGHQRWAAKLGGSSERPTEAGTTPSRGPLQLTPRLRCGCCDASSTGSETTPRLSSRAYAS